MSERPDLRVVSGGTDRPGLDLPETIDRDAWEEIGASLARDQREHEQTTARLRHDLEWRLGDWAARADDDFATLGEAAAIVGESALNLRKYVATATAYPSVRRRTRLPFYMHLEARALPEGERERLLDQAEAERWTRAEMREAAREASAIGQAARRRRENAALKRALRAARTDARDVVERARVRLDGERRNVRGSLRRVATLAKELAAADALDGLHGNARRGFARDLRRLADALADETDLAIAELGTAADAIERRET